MRTSHGYKTVSEIREIVQEKDDLTLELSQRRVQNSREMDTPLVICRKALIQLYLTVELDTDTHLLSVVSDNEPEVKQVLQFFPPFTFLPYNNSMKLKVNNLPWNTKHPFVEWFLKNGLKMEQMYPALYARLISNMLASVRKPDNYTNHKTPEQFFQGLSQSIEDIRRNAEAIAEPPVISFSDFDFSNLID